MKDRMSLADALDITAGTAFLVGSIAGYALSSIMSKALTARKDFHHYEKKCYENMVVDCS